MQEKTFLKGGIIVMIVILGWEGWMIFTQTTRQTEAVHTTTETETIHLHADFKIFVDSVPIDFTADKYQSELGVHELDPKTHLHDGHGGVIHIHAPEVTVGYFLQTLGIRLYANCLFLDDGREFCNNMEKQLSFWVNGEKHSDFGDYVIRDLDRILISYGSADAGRLAQEMSTVGDEACIYSEKCPERGKPPAEGCSEEDGICR